jgi:hypothetical protein
MLYELSVLYDQFIYGFVCSIIFICITTDIAYHVFFTASVLRRMRTLSAASGTWTVIVHDLFVLLLLISSSPLSRFRASFVFTALFFYMRQVKWHIQFESLARRAVMHTTLSVLGRIVLMVADTDPLAYFSFDISKNLFIAISLHVCLNWASVCPP